MGILGQSALVVAVTALSLAVSSLARSFRNKLVLSFALMCFMIFGWSFFFFLERVFGGGNFYRFHLGFNLLMAPVGLYFLREFTGINTFFMRTLYRVSVVYTFLIGLSSWTKVYQIPFIKSLTNFGPGTFAIGIVYILFNRKSFLTSPVGVGIQKESSPWFFKSALSSKAWIYLGASILLATAVMDHVPFLGEVIPSVGNIVLCLYLFVFNEVIVHQRLLNFSALFNRVFILIFISACFTLIYSLFVIWIDHSRALFILNSFMASFLILMLIDPVKTIINMVVVRIFTRKYYDFEQKVKRAEQKLTGVIDSSGLGELTIGFLKDTLNIESATFFVLRSDASKFRRIRGFNDELLASREIIATQPIVEFFTWMKNRSETPVVLDHYLETELQRSTSETDRNFLDSVLQNLKALESNIALPFMFEEGGQTQTLGFVALKANHPPEPWNNWGSLSVIYPFFERAALILKNMDVYVRMREKDRLAALGEMAAGLAHEIRNPLGAIKGAAQYLQPQSDQNQNAFLGVIIDEVNRLNKVVTQFLDYSRPLAIEKQETDVKTLLEKTVAVFKSATQMSQIEFELVPPAEGWQTLPKLMVVQEQMKQVLVNLVQNSAQAILKKNTGEKGKVRIGAYLAQNEIVIFVEDNGAGISKENVEKIFIPFYTTTQGGTGLGLSISARIIENHGGRLDVQSEEGKMTMFSLALPTRGLTK